MPTSKLLKKLKTMLAAHDFVPLDGTRKLCSIRRAQAKSLKKHKTSIVFFQKSCPAKWDKFLSKIYCADKGVENSNVFIAEELSHILGHVTELHKTIAKYIWKASTIGRCKVFITENYLACKSYQWSSPSILYQS